MDICESSKTAILVLRPVKKARSKGPRNKAKPRPARTHASAEPLVDYDAGWPGQFESEKSRILSAVGSRILAVEHVGSTAVPGLRAKPVIDILVGVRRLADVNGFVGPLKRIGYEHRPQNRVLIPRTEYFRKGPPGSNTHHIRMVEYGSRLWQEYLLFRDRLRSHLKETEQYYRLKKELYAKHGRYLPLNAKRSFIHTLLARARAENISH